jgi:hypothetical protein
VDEYLRKLERLAQGGDPADAERFRHAYDRAYGSGAFWRRESQIRQEHQRQERRQIVNEVEAAILAHGEQLPINIFQEIIFQEIATILMPLLEAGEIDIYHGYAPGSGDPDVIVVTANWNTETEYDRETGTHRELDNSLSRLGDLLERIPGVETDWSDGISRCDGCNRAIQTQASSWGWTPPYVVTEGEIICTGCIADDPGPVVASLQGTTNMLSPSLQIDLGEHDYTQIPCEFESGFHPGQNDSPQAVADLLRQLGLTNYIFQVEEVGQFDAEWSVWVEDQQLQNWLWEADQDEELADIDVDEAAQYVAHLLQNPGLIPGWPGNLEEIAEATAS